MIFKPLNKPSSSLLVTTVRYLTLTLLLFSILIVNVTLSPGVMFVNFKSPFSRTAFPPLVNVPCESVKTMFSSSALGSPVKSTPE